MATERVTLGLQGDGDDVDFILEVEQCFAVSFSPEDLAEVRTVGEFFDVTIDRMGPEGAPRTCFSTHVFLAIRRVLATEEGPRRLSPRTRLGDVLDKRDNRRIWRDLQTASGLQFPSLQPHPAFYLCAAAAPLGVIAAAVGGGWPFLLLGAAALVFAWTLGSRAGRSPYGKNADLRDMTRELTGRNFGLLASRLGGYRMDEAWSLFKDIADVERAETRGVIGRGTRLLAER